MIMKLLYSILLVRILLPDHNQVITLSIITLIPIWGWMLLSLILIGISAYYLIFRKDPGKSSKSVNNTIEIPQTGWVEVGWFLSGYPGKDNKIIPCAISQEGDQLRIYSIDKPREPEPTGAIPTHSVKNIIVENAFTYKHKREPISGLADKNFDEYLTFLLDSQKESEVAFLIIQWMENNQEYNTSFCINGNFAMETALYQRNRLKKICFQA